MCRVLKVDRSGFYAGLHQPLSDRAIEDKRLTQQIRESWLGSGLVYDSPANPPGLKRRRRNM